MKEIFTSAWIVFYKLKSKKITMLAKVCFLKLKIDVPLASNLSKTATLFPHLWVKLKNSFSLLFKSILKKFNVIIILQDESDGLLRII